jgi:hypothetical protein
MKESFKIVGGERWIKGGVEFYGLGVAVEWCLYFPAYIPHYMLVYCLITPCSSPDFIGFCGGLLTFWAVFIAFCPVFCVQYRCRCGVEPCFLSLLLLLLLVEVVILFGWKLLQSVALVICESELNKNKKKKK